MRITLSNGRGFEEALSNMLWGNRCTVEDVYDAAEDSKTGEEFERNINRLKLLYTFRLDRETDSYIRLKAQDRLGNIRYLKKYK